MVEIYCLSFSRPASTLFPLEKMMLDLKMATKLALVGACTAGLSLTAGAEVLASDSYNDGAGGYIAGGIAGQDPTNTTGFSGAWTSSSANIQVESGGILDGDATGSGQGKIIAAPGQFSDFYRRAERQLDPVSAPSNSTFYMSHLVNAGGSLGPNQEYAFVGFGSFVAQDTIEGVANFLPGAYVGYVGNGTGGVDLVIRSRTGAAAGDISDELLVADAENVTFNVVMALEFNNPGDEIRYWVDPTDFSNGEAGLDATAAVSGTISGFQLSGLSDLNRLNVISNAFDRTFFFDESILATEVADIPEPGSLALLGLGGLALLRRRR